MAANAEHDHQQSAASKSKKHKKKKAKGASAQLANGDSPNQNGTSEAADGDDNDDDTQEPEIPIEESKLEDQDTSATRNKEEQKDNDLKKRGPRPSQPEESAEPPSVTNGESREEKPPPAPKEAAEMNEDVSSDPTTRFVLAAKERDQLRVQVTELRKSLENFQRRHEDDTASVNSQLQDARTAKENAESRYQKLLGQVNTIKATLGERLKADAAELSSVREQREELEEENKNMRENNESLKSQISKLNSESEKQSVEISSLRGRTNLSQQNWAKERDDFITREAQGREELDAARQAMQDWEVLAMEERSVREGLTERVSELEDQLSNQHEAYERAALDRDSQSSTVDGLQRALQEVHDARKEERRELVESSQTQLDDLRKQLSTAEASLKTAQESLNTTRSDLEKAVPFEKEVREKNLLIGKLRHEAVILNDHLTKALRFLKKGKPEDNVDRQLVTNHLLHFLALDRSDPKKFQVLQLVSALLGWTDEQKEQAGISRPGASTDKSLRIPLSAPFRRVSSSTGLGPMSPKLGPSGPMSPNPGSPFTPTSKEGLAELWSEFLEREAEEGGNSGGGGKHSRRNSGASTPRARPGGLMSPTATGSPGPVKATKRLDRVGESEATAEPQK